MSNFFQVLKILVNCDNDVEKNFDQYYNNTEYVNYDDYDY